MMAESVTTEGGQDLGGIVSGEAAGGRSTLVSRNITVMGRRTSVRLEPEMWTALKEIARREGCRIHDICSLIQMRKNPNTSLTAAIRVFLMLYYRAAATEEGHRRVGHGDFQIMLRRAQMTPDAVSSMRTAAQGGAQGSAQGNRGGGSIFNGASSGHPGEACAAAPAPVVPAAPARPPVPARQGVYGRL